MEGPEGADEEQARHHDRGQCDNGDGLEREGERVDEFLNCERNDQREKPDGDGIGNDETEDAPFQTKQEAQMADDRLKQIALVVGMILGHPAYPAAPHQPIGRVAAMAG